jgi:hypothetical protein|tara:strand:- start:319 stop:462 length:144 start_codon:yes stop_codon:yes gene_type:complete
MTEPKISPLGGCYNYKKLKKEGLVEDTEEKSEDPDPKEQYDKIPPRY